MRILVLLPDHEKRRIKAEIIKRQSYPAEPELRIPPY